MFKSIGFALAGLTLFACSTNSSDDKGPGADLKCSSGKNAFDTYGAPAFVKVNEAIFTNVDAEVTANGATNLGSAFQQAGTKDLAATQDDADTFAGKLAAFLVFAYGGPTSITYTDGKTYVGNNQDMVTAHTGLKITADQYTYFISNIVVPALTTTGVSTDDVTNCFAPVVTGSEFEDSIVGQ